MNTCELCQRNVARLTVHHLVPKSQARRKERSTLPTARLCMACHQQLHVMFSNRDLKAKYSSLADLCAAPEVQNFLKWVKKQDPDKRVKVRR